METQVVNIKKDLYDVFIGRGSPYGNPYLIGKDGSRSEVIQKYEAYLFKNPKLMERAKRELRGRRLGCFCKPLACHGDILKELVDSPVS